MSTPVDAASGKSTLALSLLRMVEPAEGRILYVYIWRYADSHLNTGNQSRWPGHLDHRFRGPSDPYRESCWFA